MDQVIIVSTPVPKEDIINNHGKAMNVASTPNNQVKQDMVTKEGAVKAEEGVTKGEVPKEGEYKEEASSRVVAEATLAKATIMTSHGGIKRRIAGAMT